jgi:predicted transcriptional regulator
MADTVCTFSLDNETKKKLEDIANSEYRSLAGQIRLVIEEWLESKAEKKGK